MTTTTTSPAVESESTSSNQGAITEELVNRYQNHFSEKDSYKLAQNAVTRITADDIALNREIITTTDNTFSHKLDEWEVTNQKKSGRCWMFAGLNLLRVGAMKKMNLANFEFSQNYTLFWDKFERANYFLESIIDTADKPVDDRTVEFLLERPLDDGGQWNMFVNIIKKHGLVPKAAMPETESSSNTRRMNSILLSKLREAARTLRDLHSHGATISELRLAKESILQTIHRILCIHLGTPPATFDWQWNDKDKKFHRDGEITPLEFADKYVELPIGEYVCLVHDPRESSPINRTYTVKYLGNVVGGDIVKYLNIDTNTMKRIAMKTIMDGEPVWFGCDVGKMMQRELGLWDTRIYDYENLYDTTFDLDKANRLLHHETLMTHAMLFTGVDIVDNQSRRWRVENSWGEESGVKGYYVMNDSWFDEYMFEIAARKSSLSKELQDALDLEPTVLPPWDPMGSLAKR